MSSFDDLLRRLDAADAAEWEEEYARIAVELTQDQAFEVIRSERVYSDWFAFRFDAGLPGEPLPSTQTAFKAVLFGTEGSPLDAYRVVFGSPPISEEFSADPRLALLCNAAACALKRGTSWFATWLAARAGLAAIALGAPERAWQFLDGLTIEGSRHPHLDKLAIFEPLRRSEATQRSTWVRAAICRLWPCLGVPSVPSLPFPDFAAGDLSIRDTLDELSRIGATQVRALVESFVAAMDLGALERHADEPLVRELRKRALEGHLEPPSVDHVPSWFPSWAREVGRSREIHLARLAGLVLRAVEPDHRQLAALLVLPAARAADLESLAAGFDAPELQSLLAELTLARESLPIEAADALVATALPSHVRHGEALGVLAQHVDQLQGIGATPGGVVDHIATMIRTLVEERQRDHASIRPLLERLLAEVHREAGQLSTVSRRVSAADVERAAARLAVPELTTGLLEAATEAISDFSALHRLLFGLALRQAVGETHHKSHWEAPLAKLASDSIYALREPQLFDLRLRLLDEAIQAAHPLMPTAELHFQRANTRRAHKAQDERSIQLALADLSTAIRHARAEGNTRLCAAATAAWVKTLAWSSAGIDAGGSDRLAEAESAIADALDLPLGPTDRAAVHQARAHLVRLRSPEEAVSSFEAALALLVPGEPFWIEIAAELLATLVRVGRHEEAVQRGTEYLTLARADGAGTEFGMIRIAIGEAFLASERRDEAQRQLENGLQLVRGRDPMNEALARLHLARLGLAAGDNALCEQHLRFLRDHREELAPLPRRDLDLMEVAAVAARGDKAQQRVLLARTLSTVKEERVRVGLRIEIARLDLIAERPVQDLDALVLVGLKMDLDDHYDAVLTDVLCNHEEALAPSTREEALHWARQHRPSTIARLQQKVGQTEAARSTLLCLERAHATDGPDVIANLVHNLADVEGQMGEGSRLERLRAAEQRLEEAVSTTQSSHKKAQYMANLAWDRTQIGTLIGGAEGRRYLEKALAAFNEVEPTLLDEHGRRNVDGNRRVCEATLARLVGGRNAEIASWREYLAKLDDRAAPYSVATAKHNLANALMFGGDVTREALVEGLQLSREAAEVRTLEANPRHHWETSLNIGRAILSALTSGHQDLLSLSPDQEAAEAGFWLQRAAAAARILGPGEELLEAAFALGALASGAPTPERFIQATEEAWAHVREASAYLLIDPQSREREALVATETAVQLSYRLAESSLAVPSNGLAFILHGESVQLVERWIVRAQQPARRLLQARLSRPKTVSMSDWDAWRNAVTSRDQRRMADALDRLREASPTFLAEDHANDVTWRWLEARPGSIAVALVLAQPVTLALLMHADGTGVRRTWVLGLEPEPPPLPLDALTGRMHGSVPEASTHAALDELAQWVRQGLVEPIVRFLGAPPSAVLWSPGPGLRLVAPSAVWRAVPVAAVTSLVLTDLTSAPSRRRSSLVVLADPGAETPDPRLDLRGQGVSTLEALERAAARRGPVRLMGSVGGRFGRALLGERSVVRDTPASARDVLLEAAEHESIILVAHGEVETLEDAAVLCLDASGIIDRLDVAQLERSPDAFAGATVVLLSCQGGRMGDSLVEPGGLAGTLLAAGAACVVAPLWKVRLDVAEQVGRAVLDGMTSGDEPWTVLAKLNLHAHADSPTLGRPAPSLSERRAEQALQRLAFVAWVG